MYIILKNIAPTSVSSEQAFSVAGSFVPNRRLRLSDESIDDLCFEKSYFDNNGYYRENISVFLCLISFWDNNN